MPAKKKSTLLPYLLIGVTSITLISGAWWMLSTPEKLEPAVKPHTESGAKASTSPDAITSSAHPLLKTIARTNSGELSLSKAKEQLKGKEISIWNKDVNADNVKDAVVLSPGSIKPSSALLKEGYSSSITGLSVFRLGASGSERLLLDVDTKRILDDGGRSLINQIAATHGYAFKTSTYKDKSVYPQEVTLFHLIILDEKGNGVSDEITLYWKPSTKRYAATNAFGEPGSF